MLYLCINTCSVVANVNNYANNIFFFFSPVHTYLSSAPTHPRTTYSLSSLPVVMVTVLNPSVVDLNEQLEDVVFPSPVMSAMGNISAAVLDRLEDGECLVSGELPF